MPLCQVLLCDNLLIFFVLFLPVLRLHFIVKHRQYTIAICLKELNLLQIWRMYTTQLLMCVAQYCSCKVAMLCSPL